MKISGMKEGIKKALMLLIAVAALVPFGWEPAQSMVYRPRVEDNLYSLVETAGAQAVEFHIQGWTRANRKFISLEELEKLARKTAARLGEKNPQLISDGGTDFRQVHIQSALGRGSVLNLSAQSLINYSYPEGRGETYLTVSIVQKAKGSDTPLWSDSVRGSLSFPFSGKTPQVLTTVVASKPGEMSDREQEKVISRLLDAARAEKIDGINTQELYSVTGYTPAIKDSLEIGENEVNLNIAVRYHNDDGQTYIYIGSPLLTGEY